MVVLSLRVDIALKMLLPEESQPTRSAIPTI